jgi:hypothetical protein
MHLVEFSQDWSICAALVTQTCHNPSHILPICCTGCVGRVLSILALVGIGGTEGASCTNSVNEKFKAVDSYDLREYANGTTRTVLFSGQCSSGTFITKPIC